MSGPTGFEAIEKVLGDVAVAPEPPGAIGLEVGIGQAPTVAELVRRAGFERIEIRAGPRRDRPRGGGMGSERATSTPACSAAGWRCSRRTASTGSPATPTRADAIERIHRMKGRDDGKPSAVMYFSPLAMREVVAALGPAHAGRARRPAPRPRDPGGREPGAPLPARLPRGPRAARAAADRGPARRRRVRRSSRPPPTGRASRRPRASRTSTRRSSPRSTWRSTAGELTGLPSTVVDITGIERDEPVRILREGALSAAEVLRAVLQDGSARHRRPASLSAYRTDRERNQRSAPLVGRGRSSTFEPQESAAGSSPSRSRYVSRC